MSSSGGQGMGRPDNTEGMHPGEAFLIGASILGLIMALVVIRFAFNLFLDCCILDTRDRAWQSLSKAWRFLCPWWHRRTEPTPDDDDDEAHRDGRSSSAGAGAAAAAAAAVLTNSLELQEMGQMNGNGGAKMEIPCCVLPGSILTAQDMVRLRQKYHPDSYHTSGDSGDIGSSSQSPAPATITTSILCSICIHELQQGDTVFIAEQCDHVFHKSCMSEWVTRTTDKNKNCPNCRMDIFSHSTLNQMAREEDPPNESSR